MTHDLGEGAEPPPAVRTEKRRGGLGGEIRLSPQKLSSPYELAYVIPLTLHSGGGGKKILLSFAKVLRV